MGKRDTPTMGGSFLIAALLGAVLLWGRLDNLNLVLGVLLTLGFAAVGFVDDFKKLTIPGCKGLSARAKMLGLSVVAGAVLLCFAYYAVSTGRGTLLTLYPPFLKEVTLGLASFGVLGVLLFLVFQWLVVVGTSNACNPGSSESRFENLTASARIITPPSRSRWRMFLPITATGN